MTLLENDEAEPVHNDQQKDEESDVHEDALNELFMVQSSRHRRKRRKNPNKEESFKRFQAACHAMMMNLAAPPRHSIIIPTRKWTRTVDPATALDSEYLDPKWGIRRHEAMLTTDLGARTLAPMDRGATWMMHLPKHMSKARENPYYHDPALALPPSAGSHIGSDSQKSSSTLALEAPGAQKFSRLVALVQQRMIQRQEEKLTAERRQSGKAPQMKIRQAFGTTGNEDSKETQDQIDSDFHSRPPLMEGFQLLYPLSKKERQRKSHYVPRMRLRDFVPEGTTAEEVEELERSLMDGKGIPPRMKLRGFPQTSASPPRRKSRAQELADSFEPKEKERRLSKTKELAQSFERQKPTYPKMRLRPSFEYTNGDEEEKKLSEDVERLSARGNNQAFSKSFKDSTEGGAVKELQRPTRHPHALSGPFTVNKQEDKHTIQAGMQVTNHSATEKGASQDCKITENKETEVLHDPPRRKPHPLSQQFVQAMQVSQQPPEKVHIVIKPLPPGTSCSRCTKPSPVASTQGLFFPTQGCLDTQGNQGVSGHVVAQTNNVHSEGSKTSARVHDFFSQLRQNNKHSGSTDKQDNSGERYSDYFTKVRKLNPDSDQPKSASEDVPLEETDFFAQVREMIATSDDDDETAAKRVSDFFAQVRQMTDEMGEQKDDDSCVLCEECQIEEIEDRVESASVSLSPEHRATGRVSQSTSSLYPINHGTKSENNSLKTDDDAKSEHSAISGLWNRGRTSFNSFASSLNAISETTAKAASSATSQGILSVNIIPPRVGGLLQRLQGKKDQEEGQDDGTDPNMHRLSISEMNSKLVTTGVTTPNRQAIDYNDENDLETMAAYRKSQEYKRLSSVHDDTSSHSSYHVLPDDIREVVKRQGLSPPTIVREVSTSPQTALKESTLSNENELDLRSTQRPPISNFERRETIEGNLDVDLNASALSRPTENSPSRVSFTSSALAGLSPKKYREAHNRVMHNSTLLGNLEQEIIDTDGTTSDASVPGVDPHMLASLMLSPDLLQKRLHQAVRAIEERLWDDVVYLVNANPWLAEMCELTTNQYLLHKIAFFGATASRELCKHLMEMYPPAVYKFDQDGNVPMHLAAASGHLKMIRMLGEKFESGASIRNEDGMLPLHFTIASYGEYDGEYDIEHDEDDDKASPLRVIKTVLKFFPTAVAIGDNDGNLPIHVAAECLHGGFGVDVIYLLLDEADRQLQDPQGARFHNKLKLEDIVNDDISASTIPTDGETNSTLDEKIHCNMVKNDFGETPLLAAVRCRRGWDIIEALVSGPGGRTAALYEDTEKNNVLHLLVGEYQDPAAAMSILKIVPETATKHNSDGILPIEVSLSLYSNVS